MLIDERDASGLIDRITEQRVAEGPFVWDYTYDGLKRLETGTLDAPGTDNDLAYAYTYDRNGNRKSKSSNGTPVNYTYNRLDQLVTEACRKAQHPTPFPASHPPLLLCPIAPLR